MASPAVIPSIQRFAAQNAGCLFGTAATVHPPCWFVLRLCPWYLPTCHPLFDSSPVHTVHGASHLCTSISLLPVGGKNISPAPAFFGPSTCTLVLASTDDYRATVHAPGSAASLYYAAVVRFRALFMTRILQTRVLARLPTAPHALPCTTFLLLQQAWTQAADVSCLQYLRLKPNGFTRLFHIISSLSGAHGARVGRGIATCACHSSCAGGSSAKTSFVLL